MLLFILLLNNLMLATTNGQYQQQEQIGQQNQQKQQQQEQQPAMDQKQEQQLPKDILLNGTTTETTAEDGGEGEGLCDEMDLSPLVRRICQYLHKMDRVARSVPPVETPMPGTFYETGEEVVIGGGGEEVSFGAKPPALPEVISISGVQTGEGALPTAGGALPPGIHIPTEGNVFVGAPVDATKGGKRKKRVPIEPLDCLNYECLCFYHKDKCIDGTLPKVVRKEYRLLTDEERKKFHNALNILKDQGIYNKLVLLHENANAAGGAHSGPAFLPWHREYGKRMEFALRLVDPMIALPYWDSTLENALPHPNHSMLFTDELMGECDQSGFVGGDFAHWKTASNGTRLRRDVGVKDILSVPVSEQNITWILNEKEMWNLLSFSSPLSKNCTYIVNMPRDRFDLGGVIEYPHNFVHQFVGGEMGDVPVSANDPLFFMHHPFIDMIWEMWRQKYQSRSERETDYPDVAQNLSCANKLHIGSEKMRPFYRMKKRDTTEILTNMGGLSNEYTDKLYEYAPRPTCDLGSNCGSKYLFCDRSHGKPRCASKIKPGGDCTGFNNGEEACYGGGKCTNGLCIGGTIQKSKPWTGANNISPEPPSSASNYSTDTDVQIQAEPVADQQEHLDSGGFPPSISPLTTKNNMNAKTNLMAPENYSEKNAATLPAAFKEQKDEQKMAQEKHVKPLQSETPNAQIIQQPVVPQQQPVKPPQQPLVPQKQSVMPPQQPVVPSQQPLVSQQHLLEQTTNMPQPPQLQIQEQPLIPHSPKQQQQPVIKQQNRQQQSDQQKQPIAEPTAQILKECFNDYECCSYWAARGDCQTNAGFMHWGCKASCGICSPNYDMHAECADRTENCAYMTSKGQCLTRWKFMAENCRKTCGKCTRTRAQVCSSLQQQDKKIPLSQVEQKVIASNVVNIGNKNPPPSFLRPQNQGKRKMPTPHQQQRKLNIPRLTSGNKQNAYVDEPIRHM